MIGKIKRAKELDEARKRRLDKNKKTEPVEDETPKKIPKKRSVNPNNVTIDSTPVHDRKPDPAHSRARLEYLVKEKNNNKTAEEEEIEKSKRIWAFEYNRTEPPSGL